MIGITRDSHGTLMTFGRWHAEAFKSGDGWYGRLSPPAGMPGRWSIRRKKRDTVEKLLERRLNDMRNEVELGAKRIVIRMALQGESLVKTFMFSEEGGRKIKFHLHPSGVVCDPLSAAWAIENEDLQPTGDGLFGDENSQTWGCRK